MGKVNKLAREGGRAPAPVFVDTEGRLTDDPQAVLDGGSVLFAGGDLSGHKMYALSLWCEALTAMAGGSANHPEREQRQSFNLTVIDPEAFEGMDYYGEEMERFLVLLSTLGIRRDDVDDLDTLLWQEDFQGISVLILDQFYDDVGDEEEYLEFVEEGSADPHAVATTATERHELVEVLGSDLPLLPEHADPELAALEPEDLLRVDRLLAEEMRRDPMTTFGSILVDVLAAEEDPEAFVRLGGVLGRQLRILVEQKDLLRAARISREAEGLLARTEDAERRRVVEEALASLPSTVVVEELADAVAEADEEGLADLRALLSRLASREPDAIVRLLELSELRDLATAALEDHLDRLVPYLATRVLDPRHAVVLSVIRLLACVGDDRAGAIVAEAQGHADPRVRIEVIRAAPSLPNGRHLLEAALADPVEDVRLAALRSPPRVLGDAILKRLETRVTSRDLGGCSFLEKREIFRSFE